MNFITFVTECYYTCDLYYICDQLLHLCLQQGVLSEKLGWVCGTLAETLTLFHTKICDFPYPISDLKPWSPARDRSA